MKAKAMLSGLIGVLLLGSVAFIVMHSVEDSTPNNCGNPSPLYLHACQQLENQILSSTVRVMVESWVVEPDESGYQIEYSTGHATVMAGRYLVTHNHFKLPLNIRSRPGDAESYGVIYLFNGNGELLFKGPLSQFELVREEEEALVFAHKDEGFFERLGFTSATFVTWDALPLTAGMEVAQIDWDGATTRVDWVRVLSVDTGNGAPRLVLADSTLPGASGGGIFWQGKHVANNWRLEEKIGAEGVIVEAVTTVALNSIRLLNL